MNNDALANFQVILNGTHRLEDLVTSISLRDSLDEIAYTANIKLIVTESLPALGPGQSLIIKGVSTDSQQVETLLSGVVWDCNSNNRGIKELDITVYELTKYLACSEDEYLFPAGQTASQRLRKYAADWDIELGELVDTKVPLAQGVYRSQSIYSMILEDLKGTLTNGGEMYRPRINDSKLELFSIGSNSQVHLLDLDNNLLDVSQKRTLAGTVTQVKVLGKSRDDKKTPVLAIEQGETEKYGTIQKIIQDSSVATTAAAKEKAQQMLSGIEENITVNCIDINTIRAGDAVRFKEFPEWELLVASVQHDLGIPGQMFLELASSDSVKRRFYNYGSL